ncbi:MAG: hypothetical protein HQL95_12460 [Magnetococcales bacterium]|nr:hypothetical protein [Magnetococcales bacterium]
MNAILPCPLVALLLWLTLTTSGQAQPFPEKDESCLRCHGMATLAYLDSATGGLKNLAIDVQAMKVSDHRKLACRECHAAGFEAYPHFPEALRQRMECLDCHKQKNGFPGEWFQSIERSFVRSVHYQAMPEKFTCFSCHDAHNFRSLSGQAKEPHLTGVVARGNGSCRRCHDAPEGILGKTGRLFYSLKETHAWLPEPERHWSKVRCIECHTRGENNQDHHILGREYAVKSCVACHSRNSLLVARLYRYRSQQEQRTAGFLHSVVMNDAYVIGMTRNPWLDWGAIGLVVLAILGVGAHGAARCLLGRSRSHENHH